MNRISKILFALTAATLVFGCAEDRKDKPLSRIDVMSKSLVDENVEMLLVPSTAEISRTTSLGRPYLQGQEQIVKLKFEKNDLVAYSVEEEKQFDDNSTNKKIVFKIPIEHLAFRERTDAFGEGTSVEEQNEFIKWQDTDYFKAKGEDFKFTGVSTLPTEFGNIFGGSDCTTETAQNEMVFEVNKTGIDIIVRRDFISNYFCERGVDKLTDLAWSEETHYSLVPLKDVISKDYKAKEYSPEWKRTFGFFETVEKKVDSSNSVTQKQERQIMHRWNPNRKLITYHLDPRLNKPENSVLKGATLKGFERLNDALEESGATIRLEAVDGDPKTFRPGDIRISSIALVEDPIGAGLLGYGPSIVNPRTGEIVQARTVMYPGIMKQLIRRAYDELIEIDEKAEAGKLASVDEIKIKQAMGRTVLPTAADQWKTLKIEIAQPAGSQAPANGAQNLKDGALKNERSFFRRTALSVRGLLNKFLNQDSHDPDLKFELNSIDIIDAFSRNNMFPAQADTFTDLTDKILRDKILGIGKKKPWNSLNEEQRTAIVNLAMPYVWIPTLIHEIGHNLGLRHNFQGSEDDENFYSIEELAAKGVESELGSPYSSMMEYSKSEVTGLRVPGKYDVAALRYGYADSVEMEDGSVVKAPGVKPTEGLKLKEFGYCSDEGVALNANCNRFDEGVKLTDIVDSIIDSYNKRYKMSYYRNGRSHFSMIDDLSAAARSGSQFRSLRLAFERLTDIMIDFNVSLDQIKDIEWLNEYNESTKKVAQFFMDVVGEPDYSCVVYNNGEFNAVVPFAQFQNRDAKTCSDVAGSLREGFTIEGELGKSFISRRFPDNPNIFLDQIDVRGVWFNKVLAAKYLTRRTLNMFSFDTHTVSFLDHPEVGPQVAAFIKNMAMGKVVSNVEVRLKDNSKFVTPFQHSFATGYDIPLPLTPQLNMYLGLPTRKISLAPALVSVFKNGVYEGLQTSSSKDFIEGLHVRSEYPQNSSLSDYDSYTLLDETYVVSKRNDLASEIFKRMNLVNNTYSKFSREQLIAIFQKMQTPNAVFTEEEQSVADGGLETLFSHLTGALPGEEYYYGILKSLKADNKVDVDPRFRRRN